MPPITTPEPTVPSASRCSALPVAPGSAGRPQSATAIACALASALPMKASSNRSASERADQSAPGHGAGSDALRHHFRARCDPSAKARARIASARPRASSKQRFQDPPAPSSGLRACDPATAPATTARERRSRRDAPDRARGKSPPGPGPSRRKRARRKSPDGIRVSRRARRRRLRARSRSSSARRRQARPPPPNRSCPRR